MERQKSEGSHKTFEVLSVLACILSTLVILVWGFHLPTATTAELKARSYAKVLGYSVWQIEINQKWKLQNYSKAPIRGLASLNNEIGTISKDPWGNSYVYRFNYDQQLLFIWSLGPNGKNESNLAVSTFRGDDLGYILDLKMKH